MQDELVNYRQWGYNAMQATAMMYTSNGEFSGLRPQMQHLSDERQGLDSPSKPSSQFGNSVREKLADSLFEALKMARQFDMQDESGSETNISELEQHAKLVAENIEGELYKVFDGVNKKYKEKARSLLFNLKDRNNPELRARVVSGDISPAHLCSMTAEQLASKELSQWRIAKAEEHAQKVVITDDDVDPRKMVKKTHKGEFRVEFEQDSTDPSPPNLTALSVWQNVLNDMKKNIEEGTTGIISVGLTDLQPEGQAYPLHATEQSISEPDKGQVCPKDGAEESNIENNLSGSHGDLSLAAKSESECSRHKASESKVLPQIISMDEFLGCREAPSVDMLDPGKVPAIGSPPKTDNTLKRKEMDGSELHSAAVGDGIASKLRKDGSGDIATGLKAEDAPSQDALWEGNLQLTGVKLCAMHALFKSGEKTDLKDWPKSLEVKGRVRLGPLGKFLQDLLQSRSRAVMVVSFSLSGASVTASPAAHVKEVSDSYQEGERVGFVEPGPGYELYIFPPGDSTRSFLKNHGHLGDSATTETKDEVLIGCIVWRRNQNVVKANDKSINGKKLGQTRTQVDFSRSPNRATGERSDAMLTSISTFSSPTPVNVSSEMSLESQSQAEFVVKHPCNEWHRTNSTTYLSSPTPGDALGGKDIGHLEESSVRQMEQQLTSFAMMDGPPGFCPWPPGMPTAPVNSQQGQNQSHNQQNTSGIFVNQRQDTFDGPPGFWNKRAAHGEDDLPEYDFDGRASGIQTGASDTNPTIDIKHGMFQGQNMHGNPVFSEGLPVHSVGQLENLQSKMLSQVGSPFGGMQGSLQEQSHVVTSGFLTNSGMNSYPMFGSGIGQNPVALHSQGSDVSRYPAAGHGVGAAQTETPEWSPATLQNDTRPGLPSLEASMHQANVHQMLQRPVFVPPVNLQQVLQHPLLSSFPLRPFAPPLPPGPPPLSRMQWKHPNQTNRSNHQDHRRY